MLLAACMIFAVLGVSSGETMEGSVAFTAACDSDRQLKDGETLVLNKVLTNHGGGYNSSTGNFIAPKSGIYLFQFHALNKEDARFWLKLYHNNDYVISAYAFKKFFVSAGNSAILRLKKTDRVYLKAFNPASVYGRPDDIYTTFSGYSIGLSADDDCE